MQTITLSDNERQMEVGWHGFGTGRPRRPRMSTAHSTLGSGLIESGVSALSQRVESEGSTGSLQSSRTLTLSTLEEGTVPRNFTPGKPWSLHTKHNAKHTLVQNTVVVTQMVVGSGISRSHSRTGYYESTTHTPHTRHGADTHYTAHRVQCSKDLTTYR